MVESISDSMFVIYDDSDGAKRALVYTRKLLRVKKAYILTVREPLQRAAVRTAGASSMMQPDWDVTTEDGDSAYDEAVRICREGAQIAAGVGFITEPYLVETETTTWPAIVDAAHDLDAGVTISNTRSVTGLRGLSTISTSDALLENASRPALVVPGEEG